MKKLLTRGLYLFAIMLFAVGGIFVAGTANDTVSVAESGSASQNVDIGNAETWEKWSDVSVQIDPFTTQTYFGEPVYVIDSAEDLAALSYYVQEGNTTYASAYYLVTADINLIGKLWTPIGTSSTPFSGQFYGGGHTISGIVVSEASSVSGSGVGLFGNVTGSLVDVVVDDLVVLNESDATKTGALVGVLENSSDRLESAEVLNCYDLRANKSKYSSIGTAGNNTKIYRGGSVDGVSADYTSQTAIYNAMTINTNGDKTSTRYTIQYRVTDSNARFEKYGDSAWGTSGSDGTQTKVVKVALDGENGTIREVKAFAFSNNIPVLRHQAEGKNDQVYVINEGNRATIPSNSLSTGLVTTINFTSTTTTLTVNYGYGRNDAGETDIKEVSKDISYDTPWKQYFDLTRIGFNLDGAYQNYDEDSDQFSNPFGSEYIETLSDGGSVTLYLKWAAIEHNLTFRLGWSGDIENDISDNGSGNAHLPYTNFGYNGFTATPNTAVDDRYFWSVDGKSHTAGTDIVITFTLKDGYTFANPTYNDVEVVPDLSGTGIVIDNPGVQTSFAEGNIDNWQPTKYSIVKDGDDYTVTFEDVVADGQIVLLFEQKEIKVEMLAVTWDGDISHDPIASTEFSYEIKNINGKDQNITQENPFTVKSGDSFSLVGTANSGYYITGMQIFAGTNNLVYDSVTNTQVTTPSWLSVALEDTFQVANEDNDEYPISYRIQALQSEDGVQSAGIIQIALFLGTLPIYIQVNEPTFSSGEANPYYPTLPGISAGGGETTNSILEITNAKENGENVTFELTFDGEGVYTLDNVTLTNASTNITQRSPESTAQTIEITMNKDDAYGKVLNLNYTIHANTYNLSSAVTIDGDTPSSDFGNYQLVFSKTENDFSDTITTAMPGDTIYWKLTMIDNAYTKRIAFSGVTVENATNIENDSYQNFTISGSFTAGTSDVSVNVAFNTVTLTFTPSTNTMYIDNFNGLGSEVFVNTNVSNTIEGALSATGGQGKYTVNVSTLTSISIYKGYYLVGWYIQNGETKIVGRSFNTDEGVQDFFNDLFSQDNFLSAVSGGTTSFTLVPIYRQKTITVTGAFAETDGLPTSNDGGSTWDGGEYTLSNTYYFIHNFSIDDEVYSFSIDISDIKANMRKAGYEQATSWNFASSTGVWTDDKPAPTNYGLAIGGDAVSIGASNGNMQGVDVWGSATEATLTINPVFGEKIAYGITIDGVNGDSTSSISIGDTITFTSEGVYKISEQKVFTDTASDGYHFSGITLEGNNSGTSEFAELSGENTTITLTVDIFKNLVAENGYITDRNIFTVATNEAPNTYKIYLGYENGAETVDEEGLASDNGGFYVEVTFGQEASALASFTNKITRNGYTLVGFRERVSEGGVQYATYADGAWTYEVFNPEPAEDTTVYAVWQVKDEKYVSATLQGFTPYFNENDQVVIQGTVLAGENEIADGTTPVGNGETITNVIIALSGTESEAAAGFSAGRQIVLRNVAGEQTYIMIVTITDTLSANRFGTNEGYTYQIRSNTASGNILANAIVVKGAQIETYYTGSSEIAETANSIRGTLAFEHEVYDDEGTPVTPNLFVENATITIGGAEFGVAQGRNAIYDFNLNATQGANYGITAGQDGKYLIVVNGVLDIVPIELQFNMDPKTQTGFYMQGLYHRANIGSVTAYDKDKNELVSKFNFNTHYNYVRTNSDAVASYTANQFVIDGLTVSIGDTAVDPENYIWTVVGTYNIADSEDVANIFSYDARYLTATNGKLNINSGNLELTYGGASRIFNVTYIIDGQRTVVSGNQVSVADTTGDTLFTIIGNNTSSLSIAVKIDASVTFEISDVGEGGENLAFLGYFTAAQVALWTPNMVSQLDNFTQEASNVSTLTLTTGSQAEERLAVYTDARAVNVFNNTDGVLVTNASPSSKFYISSGDNTGYALGNPTMTGFTFDTWSLSSNEVSIESGNGSYTFKSNEGSTPVRAIGRWTLDVPVLTEVKTLFDDFASSGNFSLDNTEVATLSNNSGLVTYTWTWEKDSGVLGTGNRWTFGRKDKTLNGDYSLSVTATYTDVNGTSGSNTQTQKSTDVAFKIALKLNPITAFELQNDEMTYNNTDLESQIIVTLREPASSASVGDMINATHETIYLTVAYGDEKTPVSHIRNAGKYYITLVADENIYKIECTDTLEFTVLQDKITLTQSDVEGLKKEFGTSDPALTINYSINGESVPITLTRTAGESVGNHAFATASTTNANYKIADVSGLNFVITSATYALQVSLDSTISYTYNKLAVTSITANYVAESKEAWFTSAGWYLYAYNDGTLLAVTRVSLFVNSTAVTTEIEHALDGFIFAPSSAGADVGTYGLADISGTSTTYTRGAEFVGSVPQASAIEVTQRELVITSIEKTFDQSSTATWTSTGDNTGLDVQFQAGVLEGDDVQIRIEFADAEVGAKEGVQVQVVGNNNYTVSLAGSAECRVIPSKANVEVTIGESKTFVYGTFASSNMTNTEFLRAQFNTIGITADSNTIAEQYLENISAEITGTLSTGNFLVAGGQELTITLTSRNYTFGVEDADGDGVYEKEFTLDFTVTPASLSLSQTPTVTKEYDGTANLSSTYEGAQVGTSAPSVWIGTGLLAGDIVTISGKYDSADIGARTLSLKAGGTDGANYSLTGIPAGQITSVEFDFTGHLDTKEWVEDGVEAPKNNSFSEVFDGNYSNFANAINDVSNFGSRTGYTQTGWTFTADHQVYPVDADHADELVSALLAGGNQITLNAVWSQDDVTITVNYNQLQGSVSGESVQATYSVPYFTGSLTLSVTANNGYFFETYSVTENGNAQHSALGTNTKKGTISISQVREDITVQVDFALITISITANDGSHPDVELAGDSDRWTDAHEFNITNATGTVATTLPQYTLAEKSYILSGWSFKIGNAEAVVVDADDPRSIWKIIGGDGLTGNSLKVTVTALWEADSISFTITHNNATITSVKVGGETIVGEADRYTVHFGDTVVVAFEGNEGYKFSSFNLSGKAEGTTPANTGKRTNASITMTGLKQDGAILTINMTYIVITINTVADVQSYSQIKGSDKVQYQINHTDLTDSTTLNEKISIFKTTQTGTYNQTSWTYGTGGQSVALGDHLLAFIKSIYASENTLKEGAMLDGDYKLKESLIAVWTAVEYTITLDDQDKSTTPELVPITVSYGGVLNFPKLTPVNTGDVYTWNTSSDGRGTTYQNGDNFQTPNTSVSDGATTATSTIYAVWTVGNFHLTINWDEQITSVSYRDADVTEGQPNEYPSGTTITFDVTLKDGYVIDEPATSAGDSGLTISSNGDQILVANLTDDATLTATLNIVSKPETFRLNLDLRNGVESVSGAQEDKDSGTYYVNIDYLQPYNDTALSSLVFTRTGYTPSRLMLGKTPIATYADGAWSVVSDKYTLTTDSTIDVEWTRNDGYYTVTMEDQQNNLVYSAQNQTVANGKVTIGGSSYTLGGILPNGDIYVRYFFERDGGSQTADGTSSLVLRNVNQSGQYRFVLEIRDGVTNELVQIASKWAQFTISEAEMSWSKGSFTSYYSGTSNFYATTPGEDMGHALIGKNQVTDATFGRVVFTGSDYNVGSDKDVRVYINITADLAANYSNIQGGSTSGYYLALTGAGQIVATPISFAITGGGFQTGTNHEIVFSGVGSDEVTTSSGVPLDAFTFSVTFVTDGTTGAIKSFNVKENSNSVLLSGRGVDKNNFTWTATGTYTITAPSKTITISGKQFSANDAITDASITLSLSNLSYNTEIVDLGQGDFYNHVVEGNAVFTISGNGSGEIVIALGSGVNFTFNVTTSRISGFGLLDWTGDLTVTTLKSTLQTIESENAYTQSYSTQGVETVYAVYTDLKYVRANYGYGENQGADYYVQIGQSTTLTEPARKGFNFVRWQAGAGVSVEGNTLSVASGETILPSSVTAIWEIADPTTATNNKELEYDAQYGANQTITVADVAGSITNQSSDLTYTYRWLKDSGEIAGNVDNISIARNITANGDYTLEITASLSGYTSKTTIVNFNVTINKIDLTAGTISSNSGTYKHADYAGEITIPVTVGSEEETPYTIASHLAKENFWFEVRLKSAEVGQIFNAGTYTISLHGDSTVYNDPSYQTTFTVNVYTYELTSDDVAGLGKFFGEEDPDPITVTKVFTFGADNTESVQINFTRVEAGEAVGKYEVEVASISPTGNYSITAPKGNDFFEIRRSEGRLNITIDNPEKLTKVYNGATSSISVTFDREEMKWTLSISDSASTTVSSGLTLKVFNAGREEDLTGTALENALSGITFTFGEDVVAKNANSYPISLVIAEDGSNYPNAQITNATSFVITKANLVVSGITKEFDRTNSFSQAISGVGGEKVTVTGQFAQVTVGSGIELNSVAILASETDNVNNYTISEIQTGSITPSSETNFTFTAGKDEFTYGDLRADDSLQTILEKLGEGSRFTIGDNYTDAIEDGYAQITSAVYGKTTVSKGGYLIAGDNTITLTITSANYAQLASGKTFEVSILIAKRALDLSGTQISKQYDRTTALPDGIVWSIEGLLFGDNVTVDEEASAFANSMVGSHRVNIVFTTGQDASNYSLAEDDMPMGNITPNQITLVVDGQTLLNRDFSSIANADGESINIPSPSFNVEYTNSVNGDSILGSFRAPTRTGFTASGWYYFSGEDYIQITGENMQTVLDGAFDTNKTMTIYAGWAIDRLQITLSVQNATASVSADESADLVDNMDETYTINYFSNATVTVSGNDGFKLGNITYSGNAGAFTPSGVGTKNDGQATLPQIRTGGTITITMEEIMINVTVNGNTPAFVDEVTLSGEGWDDYAQSIAYNDADVQASAFLPQWSAPAGTYNFAGYTYGDQTSVANQTLKAIIDSLGEVNEDVDITFFASWTGVAYQIHFNVTENGSLEGSDTIADLVFGQELDFDFPVATLSGRVSIWNTSADGEGRVYERGSYLQDVGTLAQDVYVLELYTVWANTTSTLTITVGDNVARVLAGRSEVTPENNTFELEYGVDSLTITVTLNAGYELAYTYPENASNEISVSGNTITISNMAADRELVISGTPRENTLTLNMTNSSVSQVTGGTQGDGVITSLTGQTVSITFAPSKGYSFVEGQSTISLSGRGNIETTYQDGNVTVVWSGFTGDASLTISPTPNANTVTFGDNSSRVASIWANSQSVNVAGGSVSVRTGESLTIVVNLRYGYHNASLTLQEGSTASVSPQEETFDDETKTYRRTFVVSGIDENLQITITSEEREYSVQSISENADLGSVTSEEVVTMRFGSSSEFGATANEGYVFAGWYIGDTLISTDNPYTFFANESVRTYLENNLTDGVLQLIAHFGLAESEVSITNGANGTLTYNWGGDDDQDRTLIENDSTSGIVSFGNNLVIRVTPHAGYSVTSDTITFTREGQPVPDAWTKYVQPDENGGAVITIPVEAGVPDRIEVTYVANDIDVYVQGILRIALQRNYGTNVGGQILLADEDGTVVDWTTENTYLDPNDEIGLVEGANYRLAAKTDDTLYFIARINEGYTFTVDTSSIAGMQNAVINEIRRTDSEVFFSISRVSEGLRIYGTFVANSNLVTVKFQTEDGVDVPAGSISVDTSSALVNAPINNGSNIYFYAVTSANATLTINLGFNYSLKMNGEEISASISESLGDNVTFGEITDPGFTTGYTLRVTMNINAINANGEIIIYVTPKVYNLNFVSEGVVLASISGITYGQALNIPQEVLSQILVAREGYTLQGYYTFETGQGTRYVNADGSVPTGMTWLESGYTWNGTTYVVSPNFDQTTQTFSLYASWSFDKEKVTIDFIPPELKGLVDISIKDIIYNLGADTSWTYANDKYYAEILEGVEIGLRAYPFEGFTFVKWIVNRDGQELTHTTEEINYISEAGEVTISAVYRLNFTLSVENVGGTVSLWQDGTNLGANGAFDPSKDISLVASENRGYNFVGWFTADGEAFGEKGTERVNADGTSTWTYTFTPSLQPLSLKAVFEGDEVGIIVDTSGLTGLGSIVSFRVNGAEQDISSEITAHVGSQIQIQVESEYGYGVIWEGVTPRYDIASQTYFYTVLAEDLTSYDGALHSSVILLRPVGTSTNISFRFDVRMEEDSQSIENAGTLTYRDAEGNSHNITTGSLIEGILYGNTFFLEVALQPNYRVGYVAIVSQGIHILDYDTIGSGFNPVSSRIEIQTSILNEYKPDLGEAISIIVNFERDVWTDYRVDGLSGEGTEASPFIIATREDLAYMAYMINDEGNEYYASAYYLLVDNLDMDGRFWEPIGTEENPFSGTFNFDVYAIENLEHYMVYSNPTTSYNGLFWFMTEDAQILITNNALIIGLSVAGGIILLILLILLIILLVRRRNKKKMEELANS